MRKIEPGAVHILLVECGNGRVVVAQSRDPNAFLADMSAVTVIERTEVRPALAAATIVQQLLGSFRFPPGEHAGPVDFERAVAELEAFDPITGYRTSLCGIARGDRVFVRNFGKGIAKSFTPLGRILVHLDEPRANLRIVEAVRSWVKPIVSAA